MPVIERPCLHFTNVDKIAGILKVVREKHDRVRQASRKEKKQARGREVLRETVNRQREKEIDRIRKRKMNTE